MRGVFTHRAWGFWLLLALAMASNGLCAESHSFELQFSKLHAGGGTTISRLEAFVSKGAVVVRWRSVSEIGVMTYDLYRLDPQGLDWRRVNNEPIIATNSLSGAEYQVLDPVAQPFESCTYKLVETDQYNAEQTFGPIPIRAEQPLESNLVQDSNHQPSAQLSSKPAGLARASDPTQVKSFDTLDGSTFIKLTTTNAGLQIVPAVALAGLTAQSVDRVRAAIAHGVFQLSNQGQPVSWLAGPDGNSLLFYAEAFKNNYTAKNYYFLTSQTNLLMTSVEGGGPAADTTTYYTAMLDQESDTLPTMTLPLQPEDDFWMWTRLVAGMSFYDSATFSFGLDQVMPGVGAQVLLHLQGANNTAHRVLVQFNGQSLATNDFQGLTPFDFALEVPATCLVEGTNRLTLKALINGSTSPRSQWYVNRFGVNYPRRYWAVQGQLDCEANSNQVVTVGGFTSPAITVLDTSVPKRPAIVTHLTIEPAGSTWRASWRPATAQSRYFAFQAGAGTPIDSAELGQVLGLASRTNAADYIIVTPDNLLSVATTLATYRQQTGRRPLVAPLEPIYNEFAFGFPTPHALEAFLATAYTNWTLRPRYAVLLGDGTYDYRNLQGHNDNLTPPLVVSTAYGLFCSDSRFGDVDGDGLPEIALGRLSGHNAGELLSSINKLKQYEVQPLPAQPQSLLIADAPDSAGDFNANIAVTEEILAGKFQNRVLRATDIPDPATLRAAITNIWNAGTDLVCYSGHGAMDRFGTAGYLTTAEATNLQNALRWPVVVAITCVAGQYSVPGTDSLGEYLFKGPAGAIAVIAPTGLSWDRDASRLNTRLVTFLRANTLPCLGDSFRQAQADHVRLDHPDMPVWIYNLLGDPGLRYQVLPDLWMTSITISNQSVLLTWSGGKPPFQLEFKSSVEPGSPWDPLGSPVSSTNAMVPVGSSPVLFRVKMTN